MQVFKASLSGSSQAHILHLVQEVLNFGLRGLRPLGSKLKPKYWRTKHVPDDAGLVSFLPTRLPGVHDRAALSILVRRLARSKIIQPCSSSCGMSLHRLHLAAPSLRETCRPQPLNPKPATSSCKSCCWQDKAGSDRSVPRACGAGLMSHGFIMCLSEPVAAMFETPKGKIRKCAGSPWSKSYPQGSVPRGGNLSK